MGHRYYYWLDVEKLCQKIARYNRCEYVYTKYFTAKVAKDKDPVTKKPCATYRRQDRYLQALDTLRTVDVIPGYYQSPKESKCRFCESPYTCKCNPPNSHYKHEEKQTDVNIAVHMLEDAYDDKYDTAFLISGDTDNEPTIKALKRRYGPTKAKKIEIVATFPPNRQSNSLRRLCHNSTQIDEDLLKVCLLPDPVVKADGYHLRCPGRWKRR